MAKNITFFGLLLIAMLLSGCDFSSKKGQDAGTFDLSQLAGRWEYVDAKTNQIEEWTLTGENELKGRGFVLEEGDTTFIEFLNIRQSNGQLTYFAKVSDLQSSEIVPFSLTKQTSSNIEFVNSGQDFPKIIGYEITAPGKMQSYIEGPRDGQNIRIMFDFVKK